MGGGSIKSSVSQRCARLPRRGLFWASKRVWGFGGLGFGLGQCADQQLQGDDADADADADADKCRVT